MIGLATRAGRRLDGWLHDNFGRPYNAVLGVGLVLSILDSLRILNRSWEDGLSGSSLRLMFGLAFQSLLLINQLAQLDERRERKRARKLARRRAVTGAEPSDRDLH